MRRSTTPCVGRLGYYSQSFTNMDVSRCIFFHVLYRALFVEVEREWCDHVTAAVITPGGALKRASHPWCDDHFEIFLPFHLKKIFYWFNEGYGRKILICWTYSWSQDIEVAVLVTSKDHSSRAATAEFLRWMHSLVSNVGNSFEYSSDKSSFVVTLTFCYISLMTERQPSRAPKINIE